LPVEKKGDKNETYAKANHVCSSGSPMNLCKKKKKGRRPSFQEPANVSKKPTRGFPWEKPTLASQGKTAGNEKSRGKKKVGGTRLGRERGEQLPKRNPRGEVASFAVLFK